MMECGELCVIVTGTLLMLKLSVGSWDTLQEVCSVFN